jgi:hypothetical protein
MSMPTSSIEIPVTVPASVIKPAGEATKLSGKQFPDNQYPFHRSGDAHVRFMWDGHCYNKHHVEFAAKLCKLLMPDEYQPVACSCCRKMVQISKICKAVIGDHLHLTADNQMIRDTGYSLDNGKVAMLMPRTPDFNISAMTFAMNNGVGAGDLRNTAKILADRIYDELGAQSLFIACEECDPLLKAGDYLCKYQFHTESDLCCKSQSSVAETATDPTSAPVTLQRNSMYDASIAASMINQLEWSGNTKSFFRELAGAFGNMRHICAVCGQSAHVTETAFAWLSDHSHAKARHPGYSLASLDARKSLKPQTIRQYRGYGDREESQSFTIPTAEWQAMLERLEQKRLFIVCKSCRYSCYKWRQSCNTNDFPDFGATMSRCVGCLGNNCLGDRVVNNA